MKKEISEALDILCFFFFLGIIFVVGVLYILPIAVAQSLIEWLKEKGGGLSDG